MMMMFQSCSFKECRVPLTCHYLQVYSESELEYLLMFYLLVKKYWSNRIGQIDQVKGLWAFLCLMAYQLFLDQVK